MNNVIQPGLERISQLLKGNTDFSWKAIHVAGTNGKGSICHYASALLSRRTIRAGKFSSPHLVNRWDSIMINSKPIEEQQFKTVERHFIQLNQAENINASPFEILTATAFTCFENAKIKIGVIEVGMGGRLDATNIINNQAVSVIGKIAREHEAFLGNTLEEIARHKAGILRPNVPYVVNPENEIHVQNVIEDYAKEIGAGPRLFTDTPKLRKELYSKDDWRSFAEPLPTFQRDNAALAIVAVKEAMKGLGSITDSLILDELGKQRFESIPGRLQQMHVMPVFGYSRSPGRTIIVDGAHNLDAAVAFKEFVINKGRQKFLEDKTRPPREGWPVTWVLAMTEGKDAEGYLRTLLKSGDKIITTSFGPVDGMPWVKPMDPQKLLDIALNIQPNITGLAMPERGALRALCAAKAWTEYDLPIVLTGSLYLVGDLYRELEGKTMRNFWTSILLMDEKEKMQAMLKEERDRITRITRLQDPNGIKTAVPPRAIESPHRRRKSLESSIEDVELEMSLAKIEQQKAARQIPKMSKSMDGINWSMGRPSKLDRKANAHPSAETPPSTDRPYAGQYQELRTRSKQLAQESTDIKAKAGTKTDQKEGPRIRMHFGNHEGDDKRDFRRPGFLVDKKWKA